MFNIDHIEDTVYIVSRINKPGSPNTWFHLLFMYYTTNQERFHMSCYFDTSFVKEASMKIIPEFYVHVNLIPEIFSHVKDNIFLLGLI